VSLDPASFSNIATLFDRPNLANLSEEEKFLYSYINKNKNIAPDYMITLNETTKEVMKMSGLPEQILAQNDEIYRNIASDIVPKVYDSDIAHKRVLLQM
jgi:hypothetical protein